MTAPKPLVFLLDVDNTLLDNDRMETDLKDHLEREFGSDCRRRYWEIFIVEAIGGLLNRDFPALIDVSRSVGSTMARQA